MYSILFSLLKIVPIPVFWVLAQFGAFVLCLFKNSSLYRSTNINIMLTCPTLSDKQRQVLVKKSIINQLFSTMASAKVWVMPTTWATAQIVKVHHQYHLENALKSNKGMLAIVPHIGTWEMMNAWINDFGSPVIMYKPLKNQAIDSRVKAGRQRLNATLVPTDSTGVKAILQTLKAGGFSIVLPDHTPDPKGGVIVPFFNIPTLTGTLAPKLIGKTGCALVGLACVYQKDGFHIYCYDLNNPNLYDKDSQIATKALNDEMATMINAHFTHYMWGYRRFKYTPIADNLYLLDFNTIYQKRLAMENDNDNSS
nr:lysophospholipid acyltransferase family protein [Moraxella oblonga]